ncbi:hypothetical protein HQ40_06180 [Porphyromonas gulae]|nr:hypothetical protein HQ40_06180 [Porphyromonas gulae]
MKSINFAACENTETLSYRGKNIDKFRQGAIDKSIKTKKERVSRLTPSQINQNLNYEKSYFSITNIMNTK